MQQTDTVKSIIALAELLISQFPPRKKYIAMPPISAGRNERLVHGRYRSAHCMHP